MSDFLRNGMNSEILDCLGGEIQLFRNATLNIGFRKGITFFSFFFFFVFGGSNRSTEEERPIREIPITNDPLRLTFQHLIHGTENCWNFGTFIIRARFGLVTTK